jgi:hypothetical protein
MGKLLWGCVPKVGPLLLIGAAWGCDALTGSPDREEARVEVTPLAGAGAVSMVTSTSFEVSGAGILLVSSDTQSVPIPSTLTFPLNDERRFYVSVGPESDGDTASVQMEVWIDGAPWFLDQRTLGIDSVGTMTFVYRFSQPTL